LPGDYLGKDFPNNGRIIYNQDFELAHGLGLVHLKIFGKKGEVKGPYEGRVPSEPLT
jgi:hypothetical protein